MCRVDAAGALVSSSNREAKDIRSFNSAALTPGQPG